MGAPENRGGWHATRPPRRRVEGRLRLWLFVAVVTFVLSVNLLILFLGFDSLVFDTTPPLEAVPWWIWTLMATSFTGSIALGITRWKQGVSQRASGSATDSAGSPGS
jgi:hypothetical protein